MKLKYLLIGSSHMDEIVKIFKANVTMDVINEHLKSYLSEIDCLQDLTDQFDELQRQLKDEGYEHDTFDVIEYYLCEYADSFVTLQETELL